jgi:tetratricopeptide (TPR) repeat protein
MKKLFASLLLALLPVGSAVAQVSSDEALDFLLAKLAAQNGNYGEALERIERVVARTPDDPVPLFERASILLESGKVDRGEAELRKMVERFPTFVDGRRLLGRLVLDRAGNDPVKLGEAARHLREAYRLAPGDLNTGMTAAQVLVAVGRLEDAEKILANLVEDAPDQRIINYTYAQVLSKLGRADEAVPYLEKVVAVDSTYAPAVFQLVDIYQSANEWKKAAEALEPLVARDPLNLDLQRQQSLFYLRAGDSAKARTRLEQLIKADPNDGRTAFYLAEALTDLGAFEEADAIYSRLLKKTPNDPELLVSYGLSLLGQKKYDEAERNFKTLLAMNEIPDNVAAMARTQLALIELQRDRYAESVEYARPVLTFGGKLNLQAVNIALEALRRQKQYAEGLQLLKPLIEEYGTDPYLRSREVEFLLRLGKLDEARALAEKQIESPNRRSLAVIDAYGSAERYDEGIKLLERVYSRDTSDREVVFQLGAFHERAGNVKDAEKFFLELLKSEPGFAPALNYLGYMWAEAGTNLRRAEEMLLEAVRQEPANGAYVDSLGWVYYKLGNLELAEKHLTEAARLVPKDPTIQEHLGDVFRKKGEHRLALEKYRTALSLQPPAKEEAVLRDKVAEIERLVR